MMRVIGTIALALVAVPAQAQMRWQDRGFANVNLVAQPQSRDAALNSAFELFDEQATVASVRDIGGGLVLDLAGGVRVWRNLAVGIGYSYFSDSSDVDVIATIPDPLVFDQPVVQNLTASGLDHSEQAVHFSAVWFWPVTDKIDVAVSAGPSIFNVSDVGATGVSLQPNTATATGVTTVEASETAGGFHAGFDVTYLVTRRIGVGFLLRYAGASVDVPTANDSLDVGGFHIGTGLRWRF
jgi:hypothetical protein